MSSTAVGRTTRLRGAKRPIMALVAVFIGLGAVGGVAGAAVGSVGSPSSHVGGAHHHDGPGRGPGPGR